MIQTEKIEDYIEEYKGIINIIVNKYLPKTTYLGIDYNDLYQEGLLGLSNAIKTYSNNKNTKLKTYATCVIERQIKDFIKSNKRFKYSMLNESVSLDQQENSGLYNTLSNKTTPESALLANELDNEIKNKLTELEYKVYELKKEGKSNKIISIILDVPVKTIENAASRIKLKVKKELFE